MVKEPVEDLDRISSNHLKQNYLIIGSPGSGKGTLCQILKSKGYHVIALGERLRHEVKTETPLGKRIKNNVHAGILIPDDLAFALISQEISKARRPFAIEGFPSTTEQYQLLLSFLEQHELIDTITLILLNCPEEVALARICNRMICSTCTAIYNRSTLPSIQEGKCDRCGCALFHRPEDTRVCAKSRIKTYNEKTAPIVILAREVFPLITASENLYKST